jgi:phage-related minor tail protein
MIPASAYANLALVPPRTAAKTTTHARQLEAVAERDRELLLKRKIDQANHVLDRLEARSLAFKRQIAALQKRKNRAEARHERIEDRIIGDMLDARLDKACGLHATFTTRPNAASLMIDHDELIPPEFLRHIPASEEPDKVALKAALAKRADETPEAYKERTAPLFAAVHLEQSVSLIRK